MYYDNTRVKIDLDAIERNIDRVRQKVGVPIMAVIKADAYGHGAVQIARLLQNKCAFFGVSSILEAMELRAMVMTGMIMCLAVSSGVLTPKECMPEEGSQCRMAVKRMIISMPK